MPRSLECCIPGAASRNPHGLRLTSPVHIPVGCSLDGGIPNGALWLYSRDVNEAFFADLSAWLTQAGLAGASETDIVSGFCDRCVAAGLPLARALLFID